MTSSALHHLQTPRLSQLSSDQMQCSWALPFSLPFTRALSTSLHRRTAPRLTLCFFPHSLSILPAALGEWTYARQFLGYETELLGTFWLVPCAVCVTKFRFSCIVHINIPNDIAKFARVQVVPHPYGTLPLITLCSMSQSPTCPRRHGEYGFYTSFGESLVTFCANLYCTDKTRRCVVHKPARTQLCHLCTPRGREDAGAWMHLAVATA